MIKRVFWVALFTGSSHFISLLTVSFIIRRLTEETAGYIGLIDSTVMLVTAITSFGVQLAVNRNVATRSSWRSNYSLAQSARLSLSLFIILFGIGSYFFNWDITKIIYFYAPLIAINGDYSLYGRGKPIHAASLSLLKVALPNLGILATGLWLGEQVLYVYVILVAIGIFLAGLLASKFNHVKYFHQPRKDFLKFYFKYLKVGLFQVASVLLVTAILTLAKGFYPLAIIGLFYALLKIHEIYKGGLRIIVQTFFKEISKEGTNFKIDKASLILWGLVSIPVIIFFEPTLTLLFDNKYDQYPYLLPLFGVIMFFASFRNASNVRILLLGKDDLNLKAFVFGIFFELVIMISFSFTTYFIYGIPVGLLVGEMVVGIIQGAGLNETDFFKERFIFLVKQLPPLILAIAMRIIFGSDLVTMLFAVLVYLLWTIYFNKRLIFDQKYLKTYEPQRTKD